MPDGPRSRGGRPPFVPNQATRQMVQVLHAHGIPHKIIAMNIDTDGDGIANGIDQKTLRKVFRKELDTAALQLKSAMIAAMVKNALGGNFGAQRHWLALFGGPEWKLTQGIDGEAPGAGSTTIVIEGGLPPAIYQNGERVNAEPDDEPPAKANGKANGSNGSSSGH
jgi:hypothetical protein